MVVEDARAVRHQGRTGHAPGGRPSPSRPRCRLLAERTSRGLDADRVTVLGWPGVRLPQDRYRRRSSSVSPYPLVELDVEGQARVAAGQHEAVAAGPGRIGRIVAHQPLESSSAAGARLMAVPGWPFPALCTSPWPEPGRYRPCAGRGRSIRSRWTFPPAASSTYRPQPPHGTGVARSVLNPASSPHVCLVIKQSQRAYPGGGCLRDARRRTPQPSSTRSSGVPASEAAHDLWRRGEGRLVPLRWPGLPVLVP